MNNVALVTMVNQDFIKGFKAMLNSLMVHNPWFNLPIVVLDLDLSLDNRIALRKRYENIVFKDIEKDNYKNVPFESTAKKLQCTYYKLDAFLLEEYDRIVFIDSDCLILDNIEKLFLCTSGFSAVKGYDSGNDIMRRDINSGVFVVNKEYLNGKTYKDLIAISEKGHKMPDQATINIYFKNKIEYLDKVFNVEKRMLYTKNFKPILNSAKILHFVAEKPWQKKTNIIEEQYATLERKWFEFYHE